jgi:hypothetical protein
MSLYRTLESMLPCAKCGTERHVTVQFNTGEDNLESYHQGQLVMGDPLFYQGACFPAQMEGYCEACIGLRRQEEYRAFYQCLTQFVADGRLMVRMGKLVRKWLSAEELQLIGKARLADLLAKGKPVPNPFSELKAFDPLWNREPLIQGSPEYVDFLDTITPMMNNAMADAGWPPLALIRRDIQVCVDDAKTLQVAYIS